MLAVRSTLLSASLTLTSAPLLWSQQDYTAAIMAGIGKSVEYRIGSEEDDWSLVLAGEALSGARY